MFVNPTPDPPGGPERLRWEPKAISPAGGPCDWVACPFHLKAQGAHPPHALMAVLRLWESENLLPWELPQCLVGAAKPAVLLAAGVLELVKQLVRNFLKALKKQLELGWASPRSNYSSIMSEHFPCYLRRQFSHLCLRTDIPVGRLFLDLEVPFKYVCDIQSTLSCTSTLALLQILTYICT